MTNTRRAENTIKKNKKVIPSKVVHAKTSRLGFRASEPQAHIIRMASDISHKSLTDFIMDSTCKAAEKTILDQRLFIVSEDVYNEFTDILDRPVQDNAGLRDLFSSPSPWDYNDVKKT